MVLIESLIYFISIFSNLVLGFFVFLKGGKERINRIFFMCTLATTGWLISLFLFYTIESPKSLLWIGRFNFAIILPLLYFLFKFALIFPREIISLPKKLNVILPSWLFIATILTFFTPLVGKEEIISSLGQRQTIYGPLILLYAFHYVVFSFIIITILFYKTKKCQEKIEIIQIKYVLAGLIIALSWGFITTIILSLFGLFEASNYAPLAPIIFFAFVAVAILKHYLFNIKVISVEFFTVFLLFVLFISIFTGPTTTQKVLNATIFIGAAVFGFYLIKSVIEEIKIREKAQKLSIQLQKAYEDLKVLDKAKSEFISMASHQLRTPLSAIKGYISMLVEGSYGKIPPKAKEKMENVFESNERLIRIINDLLDISKIEMGKMELEKEPTQLEDLVQSCYEEMKINAEKKKLKFVFEKPKSALPKIELDPLKFRQIILNLIDNAIRYTQKGEIEIKVEKVGSVARILIKDTGEGLSCRRTESCF